MISPYTNKCLSVIIPVFSEEKILPELYKRLTDALLSVTDDYELLFINDGARDNSFQLIKALSLIDKKVKYIKFSRNFGHQTAFTAGLKYCRGQAAVIMDADLQDPPELIKELYNKMHEGYDVVYAKRRSRKGEGVLKKFTARFFYKLLSKITSIDIPIDTGDFRIITRRVIDVLNEMPEKHKFLRGQISWIGFKQTYIEFDRAERYAGTTGFTYGKLIRFALDGITSFSNLPLKIATISGFFVSGLTLPLMLYALYSRLADKVQQPGWTSLMLTVLFIGGIQLIGIGIIGEYISRLSENVRNRPLYIIDETNVEERKDELISQNLLLDKS